MNCCRRGGSRSGLADRVRIHWYDAQMGRKIWTAEELEQLSPNERAAIVRAGFENDLTKVPPELLARARRKVESHIAAREGTAPAER